MDERDEKLLEDRLQDLVKGVQRDWTARFTFFLDEGQQAIAKRYLHYAAFHQYSFWGGFETAGRKVLGLFPEYQEATADDFPLTAVTLRYRSVDQPRHQDILGSLMALNIKRELIGDILIGEEYAVIFLLEPANTLVLNEIRKIGRVGVKAEAGTPEILPEPYHLKPIGGTVSSLRLDCLVAFFTNLSREKAAQLIRSGQVQVNFFQIDDVSHTVEEGDIFSIRGYGRFVLSHVGSLSQKGRLHILGNQYI